MKQIATIIIFSLISLLISCKDNCLNEFAGIQDNYNRGAIGVTILQNNTPVNFDSVTLIEPIQKSISLSKVPLDLKNSQVKITLKNNNTLADTIVISYDIGSNYEFNCNNAYLYTINYRQTYTTLNNTYSIKFNLVK